MQNILYRFSIKHRWYAMNDMSNIIGDDIIWESAQEHILYPHAVERMEKLQADIFAQHSKEHIWLIEHPPLYTGGTSADPAELLHQNFPVYDSGRGGRYTYHGPGQRVGYVMLNLGQRGKDVRQYVHALEGWVIDSLAVFGIEARRAEGRIGIWCDNRQGQEAKIGAIGVRIKRWVTAHGFAVNIDPDLSHFNGIVPCGIAEYPVTSFRDLGLDVSMADFDAALKQCLPDFLTALSKK